MKFIFLVLMIPIVGVACILHRTFVSICAFILLMHTLNKYGIDGTTPDAIEAEVKKIKRMIKEWMK